MVLAAALLAPAGASADGVRGSRRAAPAPAAASSTVRHGIGIRLGLRTTSVREDLLVPLGFSGGGLSLGTTYRGIVGPGTLAAQLDLGASLVANRFGHLGFTLVHALSMGYTLPVFDDGAWRVGVGGVLAESSDSLALQSWDDAHGYWLGVAWLGAGVSVAGPLGAGWQLEATVELALLGAAGRPEANRRNKQDPNDHLSFYLVRPLEHPRVFAPWDVQLLRLDVAARPSAAGERIGRGWSFGLQGRVARADFPDTVIVLELVPYAAWTGGV